jgi:hypothetical protein
MASGTGFSLEAFQINIDTDLGHTAIFGYCDSELAFTQMFPSGDSRNLNGGQTLDYSFLKGAWAPDTKYAYFDLTTTATWIPSAHYDFIIDLIL